MENLFFLLFNLIWLAMFAGMFVLIALWAVALSEVLKATDAQFIAAGTEKTTWLLLVLLLGVIGGLLWRWGPRKRVLAAPTQQLAAPAGWYPDSTSPGTQRYWDGYRWTDHTA